jgi:hypothetical protein
VVGRARRAVETQSRRWWQVPERLVETLSRGSVDLCRAGFVDVDALIKRADREPVLQHQHIKVRGCL